MSESHNARSRVERLRVRETPGGRVVDHLARGERVNVLERWARVATETGTGWVSLDYLEDAPGFALFTGPAFEGGELWVDPEVVPLVARLAAHAIESGVRVHVTSSARQPGTEVRGAVVTPARMSNHFIGHALDFNLRIPGSPGLVTSNELAPMQRPHWARPIRRFIDGLPRLGLRWGGEFRTPDPVHIDDGLNLSEPERYMERFRHFWG